MKALPDGKQPPPGISFQDVSLQKEDKYGFEQSAGWQNADNGREHYPFKKVAKAGV